MSLVCNKPEPLGYSLGEHLDRYCEQEIEKHRATGLAVPRRCNTCAFRKGTYANGCVPTVMGTRKSIGTGNYGESVCWLEESRSEAPVRGRVACHIAIHGP